MIAAHGRMAAKNRIEDNNRLTRKHLSRLMAALTDFHKAQCFFMLATNIAAQVAIRARGLEPQSLQQLYNNWIFLKTVSLSGLLPITFTLSNLYLVDMLSWYMILLSALTVTLSVATFAAVGKFNPSESELNEMVDLASSGGPPECGGNQPGRYCLDYSDFSYGNSISTPFRILAVCLVVMTFLICRKLEIHRIKLVQVVRQRCMASLRTFVRGLGGVLRQIYSHPEVVLLREMAWSLWGKLSATTLGWAFSIERYLTPSSQTSTLAQIEFWWVAQTLKPSENEVDRFVAERISHVINFGEEYLRHPEWKTWTQLFFKTSVFAVFVYFYTQSFMLFLSSLAEFARNDAYNRSWNFGQIVAITVWAPPICEFIHLEMRK